MERGSMLGVIAVIFLLLWYRKIWLLHTVSRITQILIIGAVFSALFVILYAPKSLISRKMIDQGYLFLSTIGDTPNLEGKSGTKEHRLRMWRQVITETVQEDLWFGQGFRNQLVEETFRSPHNSFVAIFGRMGLTGLSLAIILYIYFPLLVAVRLKKCRSDCSKGDLLFYLCFVGSFLGAALFSPTLESPYSALVCNFVYGAFLRRAESSGYIRNFHTMHNACNDSPL
jgi:O-antigen ligase